MTKHNILIIEDHALTRFGLKTVFETDYDNEDLNFVEKVFEAPNAKIGLEIIEKENIEIVIMDLGLPDINGIDATKIIKDKHPSTKVIVLSSHEQEEDVIKAIKAGANAYCTKDVNQEKLIYIVSSVIKGAAWFDPKVAGYVLSAARNDFQDEKPSKNADTKAASKTDKTADFKLTAREKQVLALISDGKSNSEISKELDLSVNTIKVHVCNILHKLSVSDRTQAAIKAIKYELI